MSGCFFRTPPPPHQAACMNDHFFGESPQANRFDTHGCFLCGNHPHWGQNHIGPVTPPLLFKKKHARAADQKNVIQGIVKVPPPEVGTFPRATVRQTSHCIEILFLPARSLCKHGLDLKDASFCCLSSNTLTHKMQLPRFAIWFALEEQYQNLVGIERV